MDWNAPSGKCLNPALGRLGMLMSVHEGWIARRPPISCSQLLAHGYMPLGAIFLYDFDEHLSNRFTFQMHPSCIGPFLRPRGNSKGNAAGTLYSSCFLSSGEMKGVKIRQCRIR